MKSKNIYAAILAILGISLLIFFNQKESDKDKVKINIKRKFSTLKLKDSISLNSTGIEMKIINGDMFLLDVSNQEIKKYDLSGNLKNTYGKRGDAPYENQKMFSYDVDENFFYTFDQSKWSFNKVDFSNKLKEFYKSENVIMRAIHIKNNDFIFVSKKENDSRIMFYKVDISNGDLMFLEGITNKFENIKFGWWIYDGYFVKDNKGNFFYITKYSNDFLKFDSNGKFKYKSRLIHDTPLIKLKSENGLVFPVNDFISNIGASVYGDFIYVLSNVIEKKQSKDERVVDLYNVSDGKYVNSFEIPNIDNSAILGISVYNDEIFILYEESIGIFTKD